jgi:hypothetical protein
MPVRVTTVTVMQWSTATPAAAVAGRDAGHADLLHRESDHGALRAARSSAGAVAARARAVAGQPPPLQLGPAVLASARRTRVIRTLSVMMVATSAQRTMTDRLHSAAQYGMTNSALRVAIH